MEDILKENMFAGEPIPKRQMRAHCNPSALILCLSSVFQHYRGSSGNMGLGTFLKVKPL